MKRKRCGNKPEPIDKRIRLDQNDIKNPTALLLRQYYPNVLTLRNYLASRLLHTSKRRRKQLLQYGNGGVTQDQSGFDSAVVQLLDNVLVGTFEETTADELANAARDFSIFTQQLSGSTPLISPTQGAFKQSEIVDFAVWTLFRRHSGLHKPSHTLTCGFQKGITTQDGGAELVPVAGLPGVYSNGHNHQARQLKVHPWSVIPSLIGQGAENVIVDLLLNCGIFQPTGNSSNMKQLSGKPLHELKTIDHDPRTVLALKHPELASRSGIDPNGIGKARKMSDIRFVRHRMLYARPTLSAKGKVHFSLGYTHILNRNHRLSNHTDATNVMRYIFPRQFGHHNVFTSDVDRKDTAHAFKDYTVREQEIARSKLIWRNKHAEKTAADEQSLPKRLRGEAAGLIKCLYKRHAQCSFRALLEYYCPSTLEADVLISGSIRYATPAAQVSAFCRAAVCKVFPNELWGKGAGGVHNRSIILQNVDVFIRLRRYETITVHDAMQRLKLNEIEWMSPPRKKARGSFGNTDFAKRRELMAELMYYLFDSFLIPLIRGHFHVTESGVHRNHLLYFRQDVWKVTSEPALVSLKDTMLEECDSYAVKRMLSSGALGVSHVRLMPKETGMRPIINLRRRVQKLQHGQLVLGKSINSILTPAFSVLNYEKSADPTMLGSALFSANDIYPRLQRFRQSLEKQGLLGEPLYFAKVDVRACFDTIPQKKLIGLANTIPRSDMYQTVKYSRAKVIGGRSKETPGFGAKPSWRFLTKATANMEDFKLDDEILADSSDGRSRSIYIDGGSHKLERRHTILALLKEHIECNLIKLGNRYYRQKEGIPQGSILSTLLCSYFYAQLEREVLNFVDDGQSLLLRLIDDFLVITPNRSVAEQFMKKMHAGQPDFGVQVKAEKSRANFEMEIDGVSIPSLPAETHFPYCGNSIHTVSLDISKDRDRRRSSNMADSMSVEYSRLPGQTFYRKTLNALKLQMHSMLLSTNFNKPSTVILNLYHGFTEVALKSHHYIRSLPGRCQPSANLVIKTLSDLIKLACVLVKHRKRSSKDVLPYACSITPTHLTWIACSAFQTVFRKRQTKHQKLLRWTEEKLRAPGVYRHRRAMEKALRADEREMRM